MGDKKAVVMDTNFIIEHINDFRDVHQKLSETYDVFVSDVSIQERLSQKYLELKAKYDKLETIKTEYAGIASIQIKKSLDERFEKEKDYTLNGYTDLFGDNIIKFDPNAEILETVMDRVFKKTPPFCNADNASDKGFKDTLLWLSLLEYFKNYDGDSVIFVTADKGFGKNTAFLCNEFNDSTGKIIEIEGNNFYKDLVEVREDDKPVISTPLPDVSVMRDMVQERISALCGGYYDSDSWGNPEWCDTFILKKTVGVFEISMIFAGLQKILADNLFETSLCAGTAFAAIKNNIEDTFPIPIDAIQNALSLYEEINSKYQDYSTQFCSAAATIFNKTYQENQSSFLNLDDDDELPF